MAKRLLAQQRARLDAAIQELGDAITHDSLKERLSSVKFECPRCLSPDTHYSCFNNKQRGKGFQPRYRCGKCGRQWTIGGRIYRKAHPVHKVDPGTHFPCSRCGSNNTRFDYYNNRSANQPCYLCRSCKQKFRPLSKPRMPAAAPTTTAALTAAITPAEARSLYTLMVACLNNRQE